MLYAVLMGNALLSRSRYTCLHAAPLLSTLALHARGADTRTHSHSYQSLEPQQFIWQWSGGPGSKRTKCLAICSASLSSCFMASLSTTMRCLSAFAKTKRMKTPKAHNARSTMTRAAIPHTVLAATHKHQHSTRHQPPQDASDASLSQVPGADGSSNQSASLYKHSPCSSSTLVHAWPCIMHIETSPLKSSEHQNRIGNRGWQGDGQRPLLEQELHGSPGCMSTASTITPQHA